jgi:hypothetical protein
MSGFFQINCEKCGDSYGGGWCNDHTDERSVETYAANNGWVFWSDHWYCPRCALGLPA